MTSSAPARGRFLRSAWYVAAWEREIADGPFAATVLGERVVIYRRLDGSYAALENSCPHRRLPLSMGTGPG